MKLPPSISVFALSAVCLAALATATFGLTVNLTITPASPVYDSNNTAGVPGDAAPAFAMSSIASNGSGKTDAYFTPGALFGRDVLLGEVKSLSYWTKTGAAHTADPRDWYLVIYTKPYAGDASTPGWYGDRIGTEPYFSINLNDPANTWNQWSTDGAVNQLRFFESTQGAPGATFGSYSDPNWAAFVAQNALSGHPRATRAIHSFSLQTGSAWATGFTGQLDGVRIELWDGSVATLNFEELDSDGDGVGDSLDACPNSDTRNSVDVNGAQPGETTVLNTVGDNGCTVQDHVNACAAGARNLGQYVSCVSNIAAELQAASLISGKQKGEMTSGAAKSKIGK